jgi:hypothetical protein
MLRAADLDSILSLQLTVAWAGEALADPPRLGWWRTDVIDADGGGDLFTRLLPRTHAWASMQAAREAARRVDERARKRSATPDAILTLFHFGFELDELLAERLAQHKRERSETSALSLPDTTAPFDRAALERSLSALGPAPRYEGAPEGRCLSGAPPDPPARASLLARALLPLVPEYPAPHFRMDR